MLLKAAATEIFKKYKKLKYSKSIQKYSNYFSGATFTRSNINALASQRNSYIRSYPRSIVRDALLVVARSLSEKEYIKDT